MVVKINTPKMGTRILSLKRNLPFILVKRSYGKPPRRDAHMNELPVPCGPWEAMWNRKQAFYNKVLICGAIWWVFSFGMMIWTDSIYLNFSPPANPGPPSDMVEECEQIE